MGGLSRVDKILTRLRTNIEGNEKRDSAINCTKQLLMARNLSYHTSVKGTRVTSTER